MIIQACKLLLALFDAMINTDFFLFLTKRMTQQSLLKPLGAPSKLSSLFLSHNLIFYTSKKTIFTSLPEMAEVLTDAYMSS